MLDGIQKLESTFVLPESYTQKSTFFILRSHYGKIVVFLNTFKMMSLSSKSPLDFIDSVFFILEIPQTKIPESKLPIVDQVGKEK